MEALGNVAETCPPLALPHGQLHSMRPRHFHPGASPGPRPDSKPGPKPDPDPDPNPGARARRFHLGASDVEVATWLAPHAHQPLLLFARMFRRSRRFSNPEEHADPNADPNADPTPRPDPVVGSTASPTPRSTRSSAASSPRASRPHPRFATSRLAQFASCARLRAVMAASTASARDVAELTLTLTPTPTLALTLALTLTR